MVSQSQARRETNFEETEIVKDKNVSRGMAELWKDLVNRRKGTQGKKVDLFSIQQPGSERRPSSQTSTNIRPFRCILGQLKLNY